jgi:hypothetical protein
MTPALRLAIGALVISLPITGCGRFTRDVATIQIERRVSAENGPPCRGVDSDLEKKPEFASLRNTMFCKQTVEVQTVAITSDYARDVVFKTFTRYDVTNVKLWLASWDLLVKRLASIGFVPSQIGSGSGCQYFKYKLIDPVDGQTFQDSDSNGETEAACGFLSSTRRYAEKYALTIRLASTYEWYRLEERQKHFQNLLTQPVEVSDPNVAYFQRFDDGWRLTALN